MSDPMKILSGAWVLPVIPRGAILEKHAVVVQDERILEILPLEEALARYPDVVHLHFPHHALMPGLVNAHTHAGMNLLRGVGGDLPLMRWLQESVWPLEGRMLSSEFITAATRIAIAEMLRGGTTCFNDMYLFPETTAEVVDAMGIRAMLGLTVIDFPTPWADSSKECFFKGEQLASTYSGQDRIRFALAPHAPYTVGDETLREVLRRASRQNLPIHMHVHETAAEVDRAVAETGERPLARLRRLGLLNRPFMAVHMTQIDAVEHQWLTEYPVSVVHCPESNLKLASGFCPVGQLLAEGVNVALGTDGVASNNDLDMLGELRTAALLAKGYAEDATALPAWQAVEMATLSGARALGLENLIGSLEPGKQADVIAIDLGKLECQPAHDPFSQILYSSTRESVSEVFVAGKHLLRQRELSGVDLEELLVLASFWKTRMQATMPS